MLDQSKIENWFYVACPWITGIVMFAVGVVVVSFSRASIGGIILVAAGLLSLNLYCIAALLVKLIRK